MSGGADRTSSPAADPPAGDDGFVALFQQAQPALRGYCHLLMRDRDAAEDLLQEVCVVLCRRFAVFDASRSFLSWALGIAHNLARDERRRARPLQRLSPQAEAQIAAAYVVLEDEVDQRRRALRRCVERLGPRARELLRLRYEADRPLDAIAATLETTLNAINKALGKIRRQLGRCAERVLQDQAS